MAVTIPVISRLGRSRAVQRAAVALAIGNAVLTIVDQVHNYLDAKTEAVADEPAVVRGHDGAAAPTDLRPDPVEVPDGQA